MASKVLEGEPKGAFRFQGRRRNDPNDGFDHETRRELRALQVFASWLNHVDVRPENTMDVLIDENGKKVLKHYLVDVGASLGADSHGAKPGSFGHEYFADFGETAKAILGLGVLEKTWQKRWNDNAEKSGTSAFGYFDNTRFSSAKFKTQLPNYGFKDLTRADGFWAAKQMMSFKDADIEAAVKAASYSNPEDSQAISKVLIERRDLIVRHWFSVANPLDLFDVQAGKLTFEDLAVKNHFAESTGTTYSVDVVTKKGKKFKKFASFVSSEPAISLDPNWGNQINLLIRVSRGGDTKPGPYALVEIADGQVTGVTHQD